MHQEKLDCTACEERLLGADDLNALRQDPSVAGHLAECTQCAELFSSLREVKVHLDGYKVPAPSEELIQTVLTRACRLGESAPAPDAAPSRAGLYRVVLAGLAVFPVVLTINIVLGWALYEFTTYVLPRTIALYCVALFVAWASLGISLSYASLPFLHLLGGKLSVPALEEMK
jgi:hypothetical protein